MIEYTEEQKKEMEEARDFLCGYQLCLDLLHLRQYERKRKERFDDPCACEDVLAGDEAYWRARMYEVSNVLAAMKNGREKMILYYHYIKGESIERAADLIGFSRRTGYRLHQKGLFLVSLLRKKQKRI
ncbi:MAG: hypothetical protein IJW92_06780 [Clostridia bacterium]|nr:hypothetical protein [Clostridia bacterium]